MNVVVKSDWSECAVWRKALGNSEPLLAMAVAGECMDAPEYLPGGSMRASKIGAFGSVALRHYAS